MKMNQFSLVQDRIGMLWDLLLYVPTVVALLSFAANFWYDDNINLAYLLLFLASFFLIAGANRVLKTRLMLLPSSPIFIETAKQSIHLKLRNGKAIEIATKDLRFFPDYSGRSFGLTGMDSSGQRLQFVFHKGQFDSEQKYQAILANFKKEIS